MDVGSGSGEVGFRNADKEVKKEFFKGKQKTKTNKETKKVQMKLEELLRRTRQA